MKVLLRRIHLYLGLAAGLIIMNSCLTGMLLVFQEELEHIFYAERYYVHPQTDKVPLQQLVAALQQHEPDARIQTIRLYSDPSRSAEITFRKEASTPVSEINPGKQPGKKPMQRAFLNPYTGQLITTYTPHDSFFHSIEDFHRRLLGGSVGKILVGISTLFFLGILVTGLILWFPPTKAILKQRLRIKKTRNWKRLTHDFHLVLGFYTSLFLFILAFTGLTLAFDWFSKGVNRITGGDKPMPPPSIVFQPGKQAVSFDQVWAQLKQEVPQAAFYNLSAPKDSVSAYTVQIPTPTALSTVATDTYFVHPYTARIESIQRFAQKNAGQQAKSFFKPLHMGTAFGVYSKIIAFVVACIGFFMPVTGTWMWWNRTRRKKAVAVRI